MARVLVSRVHPGWPPLEATVREAVLRTLPDIDSSVAVEVGIVLSGDAEVRRLNREWRGVDRATNVLSFPQDAPGEPVPEGGGAVGPPLLLGDVFLAYETVAAEAGQRTLSLEHHTLHLVVHGVLHLLGHDHEQSPEAAREQESREIAILAGMGLGNPYV